MADFFIDYNDLIRDDGTFQKLDKEIDKLEKRLKELAKVQKKAFEGVAPDDIAGIEKMEKAANELLKSEKELVKQRKINNKVKKKTIDLTNEELVQREAEKIKQRERIQRAKQEAIILKEEKNNIASLRAQLSLATLDWKKFTAAELKNTKAGKAAVKNKRNLTKELKKLEKATGDNRRNVGNYTSALQGLNGVMVGFGGNIGFTLGALKSLGGVLKAVALGFKTLRGALISTGIGAIVVAFGALVTFLTKTQRGLDFVNRAFAAVTTTIDVIIDRISKFGEAIGLAFQGKFAEAADKFKESVSGVGDEIVREANAAVQLEKDLQKLEKQEIKLITVNAKKARQIAELERLAEENKNNDKKRAKEQLESAIKLQSEISDNEVRVAKERARIANAQLALSESTNDEIRAAAELTADIERAEKAREDRIRGLTRKLNSLTGVQKDNTKEIDANTKAAEKNAELRLKALDSLIKQVGQLEAKGKVDLKARSLALETQRFNEEQSLRISQYTELRTLTETQNGDIQQVDDLNNRALEAQKDIHKNNLLKIETDYAAKSIKIEQDRVKGITATVREAQDLIKEQSAKDIDLFAEDLKKKQALVAEADAEARTKEQAAQQERKDSNQKLLKDVQENAKKVSAIIVDLFNKQSELAAQRVTDQEANLSREEERAAKGYDNQVAFEKKALADRQAEQVKAAETAKNIAKAAVLINLVSAYAANGDKNALTSGLRDFGLLQAAEAAFGGFEEGGYTGEQGISDIAGVVHGQEYVVTASDTEKFGLRGKAGSDFGEAMGDYFNPQTPLSTNPYKAQSEAFKKSVTVKQNNEVLTELKGIKKQLASQPNYSSQIVEVEKQMFERVLRINKQNMTTIRREILRAAKK